MVFVRVFFLVAGCILGCSEWLIGCSVVVGWLLSGYYGVLGTSELLNIRIAMMYMYFWNRCNFRKY